MWWLLKILHKQYLKNILLVRHIGVLAQNFLSKSIADMLVDFDQRVHGGVANLEILVRDQRNKRWNKL